MTEAVAVDAVEEAAAFEAVASEAEEPEFATAVAVVVGSGTVVVVAEAVGNEWTAVVVGGDEVADDERRCQPMTGHQFQWQRRTDRPSSYQCWVLPWRRRELCWADAAD